MEKVNSVPRRAVRWNVALQIIAAFLIAGAVNFLSFNHYARWDFSRSQKFTLADQTKRLLRDLDNKPLHITVAFSPTSASLESQVAGDVQGLMKELGLLRAPERAGRVRGHDTRRHSGARPSGPL